MKVLDREKLIPIGEVLAYLQGDCYLDKAASAKYLGTSVRTFESWMPQLVRYRPGGRPLFRKSELDAFMKRHQELPNTVDLERVVDDAVKAVLR